MHGDPAYLRYRMSAAVSSMFDGKAPQAEKPVKKKREIDSL